MSIVDALTKAKKRQQQSQVDRGTRVGGRPDRKDPLPSAMVSLPATSIQATQVDVDMDVCARNRVIYPGEQTLLDGRAESAFRMLRTRVLQRARAQQWTTIGITSPSANDGKTLTAVNLALRLAQERNTDIFLIDLDMRNPSVCKSFGVAPPNELLAYFEGRAQLDRLFFSIGVERLLLAGNLHPSNRSSELLSSPKFEDLIQHIQGASTNPLIVIDLPPVLNTDDTLVLAPRLDAILLVTAEGKTTRDEVSRAVDVLSEFKFAGFVLNRSRGHIQDSYGYY